MQCSKKGCKNTLCNKHYNGIGYICNDCINEFTQQMKNQFSDNHKLEYSVIHKALENFVSITKLNKPADFMVTIDEFFEL